MAKCPQDNKQGGQCNWPIPIMVLCAIILAAKNKNDWFWYFSTFTKAATVSTLLQVEVDSRKSTSLQIGSKQIYFTAVVIGRALHRDQSTSHLDG